ncbi:glycoside hydrolase family 73 protein [Gracilibacillus sp. Marseille-QA3620]
MTRKKKRPNIAGPLIIFALLFLGLWKLIDAYEPVPVSLDNSKEIQELVDEVSFGKVQVNWREVAAVLQVKYSMDTVTTSQIQRTAKHFIERDNGEYTLKTMKSVMDDLHFTKEEIDKANNEITALNEQKSDRSSQRAFINKMKDGAMANYERYGILPSITIAQAVLESNWGNSGLTKEYNNLFGIKGHNWDGATANLETKENYDDQITSDFRVYGSLEDSIKDHGQFLVENKRYEKNGLFDGETYQEQAKALEDAGYSTATDENGEKIYSSMLINIIKTYELQVIDSEAELNLNA